MITTWWGLALVTICMATGAMLLTAYAARRAGRVSVVDVTWGLALAAIALAGALVGTATPWRRWLLAALVVVWGLRLAWHVFRRSRGRGEDPRYAEMLRDGGVGTVVGKVYVVQGLVICLMSVPVMAAAHWTVSAAWLVAIGVGVWGIGMVFESVGDAQLAAYQRDPDRGPVMDRGLWGWTRHPNYFGDACVWWGIWLIGGAASGWWPALLSLPTPLAMTHFLRNVTGAKLLEQNMSQRPGWAEYAARVPYFVPRPPVKSR